MGGQQGVDETEPEKRDGKYTPICEQKKEKNKRQ
jgi:hypothetical protein